MPKYITDRDSAPVPMKVKQLRREAGLRQDELAKACGIAQSTLSRIENGYVRAFSPDTLKALARSLGVTVGFLLGERERASPAEIVKGDESALEIIKCYSELSRAGKKELNRFAHFLKDEEEKKT